MDLLIKFIVPLVMVLGITAISDKTGNTALMWWYLLPGILTFVALMSDTDSEVEK